MGISVLINNCNIVSKGAIFLLSFLLFSSCVATNKDVLYLNDQVVSLNSRLNKLDQSIDAKLSSEFDSAFESIRTRQAEAGSEIDKIKGQIQDLSGRVEDNREIVKRTYEKDTTDQDEMKRGLVDLAKRVGELEIKVKRLSEYLRIESPGDLKVKSQKKVPVKAGELTQRPPAFKEKEVSSEDQLYNETLGTFQEGNYWDAVDGFKSFIKKYPKSDLADNAQFWIGESYMSLKKYKQAILAYQEVIKKYPKGNKVPNAMLRQALAFYEIKDKISARLLFKKIIKKYPNSSEAKIAKTKLNILN